MPSHRTHIDRAALEIKYEGCLACAALAMCGFKLWQWPAGNRNAPSAVTLARQTASSSCSHAAAWVAVHADSSSALPLTLRGLLLLFPNRGGADWIQREWCDYFINTGPSLSTPVPMLPHRAATSAEATGSLRYTYCAPGHSSECYACRVCALQCPGR